MIETYKLHQLENDSLFLVDHTVSQPLIDRHADKCIGKPKNSLLIEIEMEMEIGIMPKFSHEKLIAFRHFDGSKRNFDCLLVRSDLHTNTRTMIVHSKRVYVPKNMPEG